MEVMNRFGDRSTEEKGLIISHTKAGQKWAGNVTSWTKEETIDKDIKQIKSKQTKDNSQCVEMIGGPGITEFARNPFESRDDSVHCGIQGD
jgi:hypothetical protein